MKNRLSHFLKLFLSLALSLSLISGCAGTSVSSTYPLESVTQNGPQASKVYRAADRTVPQVAQEISQQRTPQEISKEDPERMFLVYPDEWYHLQRDPNKPGDTLIEVDSKEFVQQNYSPGFLQGYILASVLDNLFDLGKSYKGAYRGYSSRDVYKPAVDYRPPTTVEKKATPPLTVESKGSIIKRGQTDSSPGTSVGSSGSITKKQNSTSGGSKISGTSKSKSPPKTRVGGSGRITKRR